MALSHAGGRGFVGGTPARVRGDVDIYHIPYTAGPLPTRGCTRLVVTVHDLAFLRNPEFVADAERYRGLFHAAAEQMERADLVLADSENTARDVVAAYGLPPERVKTVSLAYDRDLFHPGPAPQEGSGAGALPPRFILSVGTIEPRKNHLGLIRAFEAFISQRGDDGTHLVLAGSLGWGFEGVCRAMEESPCRHLIHHLQGVPDAALADLYRRSVALAYPSWYEGFGIPVLEAMACGCPVVTTRVSSLPEVAGDAALLVPPGDTEALADALVRLCSDVGLRAGLVDAGLRRAELFSWERVAREVAAAYAACPVAH